MARCGYCNSLIFIGGEQTEGTRYCNKKCLQQALLAHAASGVPDEVVQAQARSIHAGPCPVCKEKRGPVEVHVSHKVASFLVMTSWSSTPHVSCRSCSIKKQLGATAYSFFLGWWGIPWGLLMTPVQIGKNVVGMLRNTDTMTPSPKLEQMVRIGLANQALAQQHNTPR